MIEFRNVQKSYPAADSPAVADVSMRIERGELLSLIGESGCGKTTTLKMINRLEEPSYGCVLVNGIDVQKQNPEELRRNIGYVFQGVGLFPHRTVTENVATVPQLLGWEQERTQQRLGQVLDLVGLPLAQYGDRSPAQLSGGQQQRVGVARALAANPDVLLMDEPFGALDPVNRAELQEEFVEIQKRLQLTVVLVTHDMTEALLMADRIAVMQQGRILQIGTPRQLLKAPAHDYVRKMVEMPKRRADRIETLIRDRD